MNTERTVCGATPRVLPRLQIPVIDISGNSGLGYLDLADPQKGVALFAYILFSTAVDDYVELFWNGVDVQHFSVTRNHLDSGVISFSVLPGSIPDSPPDAEVYYRITTPQGGNQDESPPRSFLVKRSIPGDPDPVVATPGINENLVPPEGVPEQVDTARDLTLTIAPWPIMHVGDVLTLYWGGSRFPHRNPPLTQAQVGIEQTVTVLSQTLVEAGDSESLIVNYEVRDVVNNWSLYSLPALADVQLDPNAPLAPVVVEADDTTHEINLATLGASDVNVQIPPLHLNPSDIITLHWLGQTDEGTPVVPVIAPLPVDPGGFTPEFKVLNADVVAIASGSARVYFNAQPGSRRSKSVTVSVVGQPLPLAAPTLDGAVGDTIDPAGVPDGGATVRIKPYAGKDFGDVVILLWEGVDPLGAPLVYSDDYSVGRNEEAVDVTFTVPKTKLEPLANGTLTLTYTVRFFSGSSRTSGFNTYRVVGSVLLPMPIVDNAPGDVFDPDQFNGTVVHIDGTTAALKHSDEVTAFWTGPVLAGTVRRDFRVNSDNQNLAWSIAATLIEPSRDGLVRVHYEVSRFAGGRNSSEVRPVEIKGGGSASGSENFEAHAVGRLPLNQPIPFASGLVITVIATANETAIIDPASGLPQFGLKALFCAGRHKLRIEFVREITQFDLSHAITATANGELKFFASNGAVVQTEHLRQAPPDQVINENFSLTAPCAYVEFTVDFFGSIIDNLAWR